jgi:hypothetical protein
VGENTQDQCFVPKFGLEIFFLYREFSLLKIRYWLKIVSAASYLRAFIGIKMRRKVTFGRCFHNNF